MKKIIVLVIAMWSINAQAQEPSEKIKETRDSRSRMHLGFKFGTNLSNVYDTQGDFSPQSKYGLVMGGFLNVPVGKYIGIHPEVLYSQKGFKASGSYLGTDYNLVRTTSYIDVPLLLALKPLRQLTFVAGPNYSYLIQQTDIFEKGFGSSVQAEDFKNQDLRNNILGAVIGADINIWNLVLSARYGFDVMSNNKDTGSQVPRYKNVWIQGTIGFRIF